MATIEHTSTYASLQNDTINQLAERAAMATSTLPDPSQIDSAFSLDPADPLPTQPSSGTEIDAKGLAKMCRETFSSGWTEDDDQIFWARISGYAGLLLMRQDVRRLKGICDEHVGDQDRRFISYRATIMDWCCALSILESPVRIFRKNWPHFFARFATELGWEINLRLHDIAVDYPDLEDLFEGGVIYRDEY